MSMTAFAASAFFMGSDEVTIPLYSDRGLGQWIINMSFGSWRVEGGCIRRREREFFLESIHQVRVGNVQPAFDNFVPS